MTNPRSFQSRLQVWGPIAAGIGLVGLALVILFFKPGQEDAPPQPPVDPRGVATTDPRLSLQESTSSPELPFAPRRFETERDLPRPTGGTGIDRWNLEDLPVGWNAVLARKLADFFDRMDVSLASDQEDFKNLPEVREALKKFLEELGPEALVTLDKILNAEPDFGNRRFLLYAIGDLGPQTDDATWSLLGFYNVIRDQPGARSETNHVIEAMSRLKNDLAQAVMTDAIGRQDVSHYDQDKFIRALGKHPGREDSMGLFVDQGINSPFVNSRNHSWQALGKMGPAARPALGSAISAFHTESNKFVKQTLLGTIGKIGDPAALPFLEQEARINPSSEVRLSAASAIRRISAQRARDILPSIEAGEPHEDNRKHIRSWIDELYTVR